MKLQDLLQQLGFNQNKAKTYLACLELGSAKATQIAKQAGIVRTTVYKILEELHKNELIEMDLKNNTKTFIAHSPNKLLELLEKNKTRAEDALPDFLNIFKSTKFKPKLKFYEGKAGMQKIFDDCLTTQDKVIYSFSPVQNIIARFGKTYTRHYLERRVRQSILRKSLCQISDQPAPGKDWDLYGTDPKMLRETRYLPKNIAFDVYIQIYDHKISVVSSEKEGFAFIMESAELASFMKQIFNFLWEISRT